MTRDTERTVRNSSLTRPVWRVLRTALQPYITTILAAVDAHACPMPPEQEAEVMRAAKAAAWR
jgi:hypothetical protein